MDNNVKFEINPARHLVGTDCARTLRKYRLIARFECGLSTVIRITSRHLAILDDINPLYPPSTHPYLCHPVPLFLTSQDDGPYPQSLSLHAFFTHFNISFEGACSPLYSIINMSTLPAVGELCSTHVLIAQCQCSMTNSTRYKMDRQMVPSRPSRGRPSAIA